MKLFPEYAQNIIVGTIFDNAFSWYVTEKDLWFLDMYALKNAYSRHGYDLDITDPRLLRSAFPILNERTFVDFRLLIHEYIFSTPELRELLLMILEDDQQSRPYEMYPSLLVDFDNQELFNCYYEPEAFENVVPKGWKGKYHEFLDHIPVSERYWVTSDCKNLFHNANGEQL
jgi:hypothetical protein